jgi:hypothetical protein
MDELILIEIDYLTASSLADLKKRINKIIEEEEDCVVEPLTPTYLNGEYVAQINYYEEEGE